MVGFDLKTSYLSYLLIGMQRHYERDLPATIDLTVTKVADFEISRAD